MNEKFTTLTLPVFGEVEIIEGKGSHYFSAMESSGGNSGLLVKYLILQLVFVGGKILSEKQLYDMHMRDISYITEVITLMLSNEVELF